MKEQRQSKKTVASVTEQTSRWAYLEDLSTALTRMQTLFEQGDIDPAIYAKWSSEARRTVSHQTELINAEIYRILEAKGQRQWSFHDRIMHAMQPDV